jgi:hypothetical protein
VASDAREPKILQHLKERGLERERQLCDLVQEEGASVGVLELSRLPPMGAGESALLVTEELGLEQSPAGWRRS